MINEVRIPMAQVLTDTTIRIRITGKLRAAVRMWLGMRLLKVAAAVIGCAIDITTGPLPVTYNEDGAPRRLSVEDPGYDANVGNRLSVYVDGVEREKVIAYDVDAGTVERWGDDYRIVTDKGAVSVRWRDAA